MVATSPPKPQTFPKVHETGLLRACFRSYCNVNLARERERERESEWEWASVRAWVGGWVRGCVGGCVLSPKARLQHPNPRLWSGGTGQVMTQKQHVEQVVEFPVEVVHVPKIMTQTRVMQQHVEQVVEVPIPSTQEEIIHVPELTTETRVVHQPVEQILEARPDQDLSSASSHDRIVWTGFTIFGGTLLGSW